MTVHFIHENFNVMDLEKSIKFYDEALGLKNFQLELTWLADRTEKYDLGDEEFHLAFRVDDYDAAFKKHSEMGCVVYVNEKMGIYFITDPDGYWLEIVPVRE